MAAAAAGGGGGGGELILGDRQAQGHAGKIILLKSRRRRQFAICRAAAQIYGTW
jgi:hypothetical protein